MQFKSKTVEMNEITTMSWQYLFASIIEYFSVQLKL